MCSEQSSVQTTSTTASGRVAASAVATRSAGQRGRAPDESEVAALDGGTQTEVAHEAVVGAGREQSRCTTR